MGCGVALCGVRLLNVLCCLMWGVEKLSVGWGVLQLSVGCGVAKWITASVPAVVSSQVRFSAGYLGGSLRYTWRGIHMLCSSEFRVTQILNCKQ